MSASNALETALLQHIFQNADIANVGDATGLRGSSTAGSLYVALHTADPGEGGAQNANEASFTNYARVAVARTSGKWSVSNNVVTNIDPISFPTSGSSQTVSHFSIGVAASGATVILFSGALDSPLNIVSSLQPTINSSGLTVTCDP